MAWAIYTTEGLLVFKPVGEGNPPLTEEQAVASAEERNRRAADLGLAVRYEAKERA